MKFTLRPTTFILALLCLTAPFMYNACTTTDKDPVVKPEPTMPPATTEGKNTFGCLLNGKLWLTNTDAVVIGGYAMRADVHPPSGGFLIEGKNGKGRERATISLSLSNIHDTGYYPLANRGVGMFSISRGGGDHVAYEAAPMQKGYLHVTRYDITKGIFSGTFAFDVYVSHPFNKYENQDTLHITEGRFDIKK